jgi:hypothetical protein
MMHICASWDDKQYSFWVFSFSWHKKFIFYFSSTKNGFFCEAPTKNMLQKWTYIILENIIPYFMHN